MKKTLLALALAVSATSASATPIALYFEGKYANTPTNNITLTGADGNLYQYQGSNPPPPLYTEGRTFKMRFQMSSNFDPNNLPANSDDGVYRIPVGGTSPGSGLSASVDELFMVGVGLQNGPGINASGLEIVYDPKTGSYTMDMKPGGYDLSASLPSYTYDPVKDVFQLNCAGGGGQCGSGTAHGTADGLLLSGIPIYSPDGKQIGSTDPLKVSDGLFNHLYVDGVERPLGGNGGGTSSGGDPVPAPPAAALFAGALALLALRSARRRKGAGLVPA